MKKISSIAYDSGGRIVSWVEDGYSVTVNRDPSTHAPLFVVATQKGRPPMSRMFTYDGNGNLISAVGDFISDLMQSELIDLSGASSSSSGQSSSVSVTEFSRVDSNGNNTAVSVSAATANFSSGTSYVISNVGTTNWTAIGVTGVTPAGGVSFTYNGVAVTGSGGTAFPGKSVPVSVTVNGVLTPGFLIYDAAGNVVQAISPDVDSNAQTVFVRANNTPDATKQKTQTRTVLINGISTTQTRLVTRNSLNQILSISQWA